VTTLTVERKTVLGAKAELQKKLSKVDAAIDGLASVVHPTF
jgi:hypothetical protein